MQNEEQTLIHTGHSFLQSPNLVYCFIEIFIEHFLCPKHCAYTSYTSSYLFLVVDTADAPARSPLLAATTLCCSEDWMLTTNKVLPSVKWKSLHPGGYTLPTHSFHPTHSQGLTGVKNPANFSPSGISSGYIMLFKLSVGSDQSGSSSLAETASSSRLFSPVLSMPHISCLLRALFLQSLGTKICFSGFAFRKPNLRYFSDELHEAGIVTVILPVRNLGFKKINYFFLYSFRIIDILFQNNW